MTKIPESIFRKKNNGRPEILSRIVEKVGIAEPSAFPALAGPISTVQIAIQDGWAPSIMPPPNPQASAGELQIDECAEPKRAAIDLDQRLLLGLPHGVSMVRLCEELQVLVTALIFSLALTLGAGSPAFASAPDMSAGQHDTASGHHASSPRDACAQEPCSDHNADCISGVAHCSGSGCTAFVAPVEARGLGHSGHQTWSLEGTLCLSGVDPLVARHPPRDLA